VGGGDGNASIDGWPERRRRPRSEGGHVIAAPSGGSRRKRRREPGPINGANPISLAISDDSEMGLVPLPAAFFQALHFPADIGHGPAFS